LVYGKQARPIEPPGEVFKFKIKRERSLTVETVKKMREYILGYSERGQCTCGKCLDGSPEASKEDNSHSAFNGFFTVSLKGNPNKEDFQKLAEDAGIWPASGEISYLQMGAALDDQGIALQAMGMGDLLGAWRMLTPQRVFGDSIDSSMAQMMAGQGYVTVREKENRCATRRRHFGVD
jgi:hypothetical protein